MWGITSFKKPGSQLIFAFRHSLSFHLYSVVAEFTLFG